MTCTNPAQNKGNRRLIDGGTWDNYSGTGDRCERVPGTSTNTHLLRGRARRGR